MNAQNKIRIALLGTGGIACRHASYLMKMEDVEIVALCSSKNGASNFNQRYGTNYPVYNDFDQMLDEVSFDALYVTLPPHAHNGQIEKAAAKNIHIFAEKPLASSVERAESIAKAVEEYGVKFMMGYHMRFGGAVQHVRRMMEKGVTGRPILYHGDYECKILPDKLWWRHQHESGGQVFEQIIHLYDMAYYLMGEVETVTGMMDNICHKDVPEYTIEDVSVASLRFRNQALGSIIGSNCSANYQCAHFKVVFENCVAEFKDMNHVKLTYANGNVRQEELHFDTDPYLEENRYFIDMIKGKRPEVATAQEGLTGVRIVDSVVRSARTGGTPLCV